MELTEQPPASRSHAPRARLIAGERQGAVLITVMAAVDNPEENRV
jgi:hypothetical protein